jgi:hypothetical protein
VWLNHHTSRTSSAVVLLFFPLYVIAASVRVRTAIITGALGAGAHKNLPGRLNIARESLWIAAIGVSAIAFVLELYSPDDRWRRPGGRIRLEDDEAVGKENDEAESPVATANIYER